MTYYKNNIENVVVNNLNKVKQDYMNVYLD